MPYVNVRTNVSLDTQQEADTASKLSALLVEQLGKGIEWVMADVAGNCSLVFGGSDESAAYVRLGSIGLAKDMCPALSAAVCAFFEQELAIAQNRVYIEFADLGRAMFGWNGKTLG